MSTQPTVGRTRGRRELTVSILMCILSIPIHRQLFLSSAIAVICHEKLVQCKRCEEAELRLVMSMQANEGEVNRLQLENCRLREMLEVAGINPDTGFTMV